MAKAKAKPTVADWRKYLADPDWVKTQWIEDEVVLVDGAVLTPEQDSDDKFLATLPQSEPIHVEGAIVDGADRDFQADLGRHFMTWWRRQTHVVIGVRIERGKEAELAALIKTIGGEIA